jgi:hypothetical protein
MSTTPCRVRRCHQTCATSSTHSDATAIVSHRAAVIAIEPRIDFAGELIGKIADTLLRA